MKRVITRIHKAFEGSVLRAKTKRVEPHAITSPELQKFFDNLVSTVKVNDALGVSAPQVGRDLRAFVLAPHSFSDAQLEAAKGPSATGRFASLVSPSVEEEGSVTIRDQDHIEGPYTMPVDESWDKHVVVVNPKLLRVSKTMVSNWEGCLSIPGFLGVVKRHKKIEVEYLNRHGEPVQVALEGLPAVVFQHEYDHMNGVLYTDRVTDPDTEFKEDPDYKKQQQSYKQRMAAIAEKRAQRLARAAEEREEQKKARATKAAEEGSLSDKLSKKLSGAAVKAAEKKKSAAPETLKYAPDRPRLDIRRRPPKSTTEASVVEEKPNALPKVPAGLHVQVE